MQIIKLLLISSTDKFERKDKFEFLLVSFKKKAFS